MISKTLGTIQKLAKVGKILSGKEEVKQEDAV